MDQNRDAHPPATRIGIVGYGNLGRGVEAETYACGTGVSAVQVVLSALGLAEDELANTTTGGEVLTTSLENGRVFLKGAAELTFTGEINVPALGLPLP